MGKRTGPRLAAATDWLDRLPPLPGLGLGAAVGFGGGLLLLPGGTAGAVGCGLLLLGGAALCVGAQPLADVGLRAERQPLPEPLAMVELPGGAFLMGSDDYEDERPPHRVTVAPFAMAAHATTQALYQEVCGNNPGEPAGATLPVNNVSWFDAVAFCNALSLRVGLRPCYRIDGGRVSWDRAADGYRLPTEAEWEYAQRGGTTTRHFWGDEDAGADAHAWFAGNSGGRPHPVAKKRPNPFGLFDMAGNVWEWCWDPYDPYSDSPGRGSSGEGGDKGAEGNDRDFQGDDTERAVSSRVLRGGSFFREPVGLRSANRFRFGPEDRRRVVGFRCVRSSRQHSP